MKEREHLPVFGIGPVCVYLMVFLLIAGIVLRHFGCLQSGDVPALRLPLAVVGVALTLFGAYLWVQSVIVGKVADEIVRNHLVTTGVYAWVRNPIYSGIAIALIGISCFFYNLWFLAFAPLFWLDITLLMKATEEKWLLSYYGDEYRDYCRKVNRCIPWFPKK